MARMDWLGRLLSGPTWRVAEQADAQATAPLAYPATLTLGDVEVSLRFLAAGDQDAILTFARHLPPHDLLFLRRDITDPDQVDQWIRDIEHGLSLTVLALRGDEIVGYATVASDGLNWTRHVRELRVLVSPTMRGKNLGRLLTEQAFAIAKQQGVRKMIAQMTPDQKAAVKVFREMGFEPEARMRGQVMDRDGVAHDLLIMGLDVDAFQSKLDAALMSAQQSFMNV
ncbi:MAG: N-acetyltransferase family protein [Dehalococcoidia bacterium]